MLGGQIAKDARSVKWPWYHDNLENDLSQEARDVLEKYSGIAPEHVKSHIYKIVSR